MKKMNERGEELLMAIYRPEGRESKGEGEERHRSDEDASSEAKKGEDAMNVTSPDVDSVNSVNRAIYSRYSIDSSSGDAREMAGNGEDPSENEVTEQHVESEKRDGYPEKGGEHRRTSLAQRG
ncbi:hypothetical protein QAD02_011915 [Eretmocerus hayati]|uniref:Uncharacterized protein n=1 Tax=Eretmocerus hayati TaxID=131215 RepID=A0ACC2P0S7_9HYME|nr:hypothetical protein QAD02_011915 [Eretmocerus hayati]